jgi:hypothetical protein
MKEWLRALLAKTWLAGWTILSALSTMSTFVPHALPSRLRPVLITSAIAAFALANFRVFQSQEADKGALRKSLASHETRVSDLEIESDRGSRYILSPIQNVPRSDFQGGYFEFNLMIENRGRRNSTVTRYEIEIIELKRHFRDLVPIENQNSIQGRHSQFGVSPSRCLSVTGNVEIPAESTTRRGMLLFHVPDLSLEEFASAGLTMRAQDRRFGALHCRLTIADRTEVNASHVFTMVEA